MAFYFIFLIINFLNIKTLLIISLKILNVDDCVSKVKLENNIIFQNNNCHNEPKSKIIEISYEIGQTLNVEVNDSGGKACSLKSIINVYNIYNLIP